MLKASFYSARDTQIRGPAPSERDPMAKLSKLVLAFIGINKLQ